MSDDDIKGVVVNVLRESAVEIEFLYLQRSGGNFKDQWWPVAGTCETGESAAECVVREVKEETGLNILSLYEAQKEIMHTDQKTKLKGFVAFVSSKAQVKLNYEHSNYKWLNAQGVYELLPLIVHPYIKYVEDNFIREKEIKARRVIS